MLLQRLGKIAFLSDVRVDCPEKEPRKVKRVPIHIYMFMFPSDVEEALSAAAAAVCLSAEQAQTSV